jgi:tRNA modification GTPase
LGVVRLSGPDAQRVAQALVRRNTAFEPRHATFAHIVEPAGQDDAPRLLDQVVVTLFAGPHSYTGDDVVEISAHGSPVVLQRVVELAMAAGARLAEPGEFTLRAYLNGRIDLVQAEAVADLVDAVTPLQARAALDQLEGTLTGAIGRIDAAIFDLSARLEASLDFPDEGFHFITRDQTRAEIARIGGELAALSAEGRVGRVVREGRTVVIVGRPNAGKSSLFNALAGASRAIVTAVPGTTRDLLTERVDIGGSARHTRRYGGIAGRGRSDRGRRRLARASGAPGRGAHRRRARWIGAARRGRRAHSPRDGRASARRREQTGPAGGVDGRFGRCRCSAVGSHR